ncbi:class I adenylate-forming enzyme family protein [Nocardia sp. alder85J]|uniref:class I adenylate-forming enzyme family protein n=1 Tax=Nocardia sp. alder85J TaxID=2862949 RepID=UPI001CD41897|nr:class I adenylate-forming enzyme family protein [Nocardia sp. alder85J]MCX4096823.1 class I adenylate-forming enzyme family protein [Nocardia sp. alder85J]
MSSPSTSPAGTDDAQAALSIWQADRLDRILDESIPQVLARQAESAADRPALIWFDGDEVKQLTFAELSRAATTVAGALAAATRPGDRIAVWSRNSVDWVVLQYGCALAGLLVTGFNTAWTDPEVRYAMELTTPALVFTGTDRTGADLAARASELCGTTPVLELATVRGWAEHAPQAELPRVKPTDPFLIQFTSGTTGRAKGAVLSHRALLNAALARLEYDLPRDGEIWLNPVPYHHIGGFCHIVLGGLLKPCALVVMERFDADRVVTLLRRRMVTRLGGVPTMITDIVNRLGGDGRDLGLVSVGSGGATVTRHLIETVREVFGAAVTVTYGQSECPTATHTPPDADDLTVSTTIGRPVAGSEIRIVDPATDAPVPLGEIGELRIRSPYLMDGYWRMPDKTAETIGPDGFLHTGDLASMDAAGYLTFRGRQRDVIIRGGENVYPAEVEEVLIAHPGIADVVLVGVDDERLGERVAGVVIRAAGSRVGGDELTDYLRERVAYFKIPSAWHFVDSLPMTASGKVQRFLVRQSVNGRPAPGTAATPRKPRGPIEIAQEQ